MPFQLMVQDRVPELTLMGAQGLASGVAEVGRAGARLFDKLEEKKEKEKKEAKLSKAYDVFGEQLGISKDKLSTMSLEDKVQMVEGMKFKSTLDELKARTKQHEEERAYLGERRSRETATANAMPRVMKRISEMGQNPEDVPSPWNEQERARRTAPVTPQSIAGAFAAEGAEVTPQGFADMIRAMESSGTGSLTPSFTDVPGTDTTLARVGKQSWPIHKKDTNPRTITMDGSQFYWNGSGWNPMPHDTSTRDTVDMLKSLDSVNENILKWNAEDSQSKRSKTFPAPDPKLKQAYESQRDTILGTLQRLGSGKANAGTNAAPAKPVVQKSDAKAEAKALLKQHPDKADAIKRRYRELYNEDLD